MRKPRHVRISKIYPLITAALVTLTIAPLLAAQASYSPGGWPTLHQDAGNRRSVDVNVLDLQYQSWTALSGAAVLTAPVTSPDGRNLYVATGLAEGQSNLHAFSLDGALLWQAPAWTDPDNGIDPCAILSSPIVDSEGDIYLNDCNQLFAFHADGAAKWVRPLPPTQAGDWLAAGDHPVNAFTTAAFTNEGELVGVTNFGDVVLVDRATGATLNAPYRLRSALAPYADKYAMPDSMLGNGLMAANFREWAWQLLFAGNMRSANTPAVGANGRIFVVGSSEEPGIGALYGFDIDRSVSPFIIRSAFSTKIGIGSGSSPALSPDEQQVYVSDELGWFYALDSNSGEILWKVQTAAAAGAAAVGSNGNIYALQEHPAPGLIALSKQGEVLWQSDMTNLLQDKPSHWLLGDAVAVANGNPSVSTGAVLIPVMYGYEIPFSNLSIPFRSTLIAVDADSGKAIREVIQLLDDSSGVTAVLPDGTLVNSLGSVMTSALSPLNVIVDWLLPSPLTMQKSVGGIQVSRPTGKSDLTPSTQGL